MAQQTTIESTVGTPSITTWTRVEPLPRDDSMQQSLQQYVRDPLWILGRQYQFGEFLADDRGSPAHAMVQVEFRTVTTYRPGEDDSKTVAIDSKLPIEVHVEREAVALQLRGSVQLGLYFESLLRSANVDLIFKFRQAYRIEAKAEEGVYAMPEAVGFRGIVTTKVTDGEALYCAAPALIKGQTPRNPLTAGDITDTVKKLLGELVSFRQSVFSEPSHDAAWQPPKLTYDFALGSPVSGQNLLLTARDFPGGRLDWYSFLMENGKPNTVATRNAASVNTQTFDLLPNHVVFRGMPEARVWNFEDGATDFGQLDVDHVDLAKLLFMESAFNYNNDWFSIPVPVTVGVCGETTNPLGTLSRVLTLVVMDTFGVRELILPAEQTKVSSGKPSWSMYKISGGDSRSDFILLAPTLGVVDDAEPLERVLFLRDDMAAMAWAVEQLLQSDLDSPVDPYHIYLDQIKGEEDAGPPYTAGGPEIYYWMAQLSPNNWIPLVPIRTPQGGLYLRRGTIKVPDPKADQKFKYLKAHAVLLKPGYPSKPDDPLFLADHAVPRSGWRVDRYFRRTRCSDGCTFLWLARKSTLGRGPGWSGLAFDRVRDIDKNKKPPK